MHPLFLTIIRRPDLVVDHMSAYGALLTQEAGDVSQTLVKRTLIWVGVVMFGSIGVVLSGTALMLGVLQNQFHWILVAVPGLMLLCSMVALTWTRKSVFADHVSNIKSQLFSDTTALRIAAGLEAK